MLGVFVREGDVPLLDAVVATAHWTRLNRADQSGMTPLDHAVSLTSESALAIVQTLCAHGADPRKGGYPLCLIAARPDVRAFLRERADSFVALHFFDLIESERLRAMLGRGALQLAQRAHDRARSPVQLAAATSDAKNARVLLSAAEPWSPTTHALWPPRSRALARQLLLVAVRLRSRRSEWAAIADPWTANVVPRCLGDRVAGDQWNLLLAALKFVRRLRRRVVTF
jgi:hypothetical protein